MPYVLITLDDQALAEECVDITESLDIDDGVRVYCAGHVDAAKQHFADLPIDLLMTGLHLRSDLKAPMDESEECGLSLIRWVNENHPKTPSVLITPNLGASDMQRISNIISDFHASSFVFEGSELLRNLTECVKSKLKKISATDIDVKPARFLTVEITVGSESEGEYHIFGCGYTANGKFKLDQDRLEDLRRTSRLIGTMPEEEWEDNLSSVGKRLLQVLQNHSDFQWDLAKGLERADGDIARTRVCFIVQREYHPLLVEALSYPRSQDYWMLRAPFFRRLPNHGSFEQSAPFRADGHSDKPINFLIINANIHNTKVSDITTAKGEPLYLESLTKVDDECRDLKEQLEQLKEGGANIGDISALPLNGTKATSAEVKRELTSRTWDVVHFAGHSYFSEKDNRGYVFFQDDFVKPIEIAEFSQWLRHTRFVFLSSCRSTEKRFVYELADYQVPAICGFRWKVADEKAYTHALTFYEHLFSQPSIEEAFLKTRQSMHEKNAHDRTWAAPMLILQS